MCSNRAITECRAWLWRLKALLLVSKEAISFCKVPFSHVINDSFQCAHLSAACPPELSQVCLSEKGERVRRFPLKKKNVFSSPPPHPKLYIINRLTQSLLLCECIGDVSEVNARDDLLRILDGRTQVTLFPLWSHPRLKSNTYISCDSPCQRAASTAAARGDDNRAWVRKCQTERWKCCLFID